MAEIVGLHPSISHDAGLKLFEKLEEIETKEIPSAGIAEFSLKYNYFKFDSKVKHQISGTAIETMFASIFKDKVETELQARI